MANPNKISKTNRIGSALEHGEAHERDHRQWSRRSFLQSLGITSGGSILLGSLPVTALLNSPLAMALNEGESDRILVLIRLKGGNDGLNMIIPLSDYGTYQALRPTIRIPQSEILNLNPALAFPKRCRQRNPCGKRAI